MHHAAEHRDNILEHLDIKQRELLHFNTYFLFVLQQNILLIFGLTDGAIGGQTMAGKKQPKGAQTPMETSVVYVPFFPREAFLQIPRSSD